MNLNYRVASLDDIDMLVSQRLDFVEVYEADAIYDSIKTNCFSYFQKAFADDTCDVILAETDGNCVGTGIIFYYDSVPSKFNITGKNAYITSMYVRPEYRKQGIGMTILKNLVDRANERGYNIIMLNASEMGKPMYRKMGFMDSQNGMFLKISNTRK